MVCVNIATFFKYTYIFSVLFLLINKNIIGTQTKSSTYSKKLAL